MSCDHISAIPFPEPDNTFSAAILNVTNARRAQHGVGNLTWDPALAASAFNDVGKTCNFVHSNGHYGQNLALDGAANPDVAQVADRWYAWEACAYDYGKPAFSENAGHFTQVVWKAATKIGCALVSTDHECPRGIPYDAGKRTAKSMLICNYDVGNIWGQYVDNVVKPLETLVCASSNTTLPVLSSVKMDPLRLGRLAQQKQATSEIISVTAVPSPSVTADQSFATSILTATNDRRERHGVAPLKWNNALANDARAWANNCYFGHKTPPTYGQNIAMGGLNPDVGELADRWYKNEACLYDYGNPVFSEGTGHFTQTVWAGTREMGCALVSTADVCKKNGIAEGGGRDSMLFCNYYPPGNRDGEFQANVNRPNTHFTCSTSKILYS